MYEEAKSSYFASRFLPRAKREALEALYGVFRTADNLADEPQFSPEQRRSGLASIRSDLAHIRDPEFKSAAPWFPAARRAFASFPIRLQDALRLVSACEGELGGVSFASIDQLERFAVEMAGSVARCTMAVLGASDPDSLERADRLATALQITNALRDVERDLRAGRTYVPSPPNESDRLEIKRRLASIAHSYYDEAPILASRVPNDGSRLTILLALDIYRALLVRLERRNFDVSRGRPRVGFVESVWRALRVRRLVPR